MEKTLRRFFVGSLLRSAFGATLLFAGIVQLQAQATKDKETALHAAKPSDQTIVVTWTFAAARTKVFEALTRPDQVVRWFRPERMSLVSYESDFRSGGTYRYVFQRPSGKKLEMSGAYREVDPPRRWVHTETYDFSPLTLIVTTALEDVAENTVLTQTIQYESKADRDGDFEAVASSSAEIYRKLDNYLKSQ